MLNMEGDYGDPLRLLGSYQSPALNVRWTTRSLKPLNSHKVCKHLRESTSRPYREDPVSNSRAERLYLHSYFGF